MSPRTSMRMFPCVPTSLACKISALAAACLMGCSSGTTNELPASEAPPATAKERALKNPRMKADLEANSKGAKGTR